MFYNRFKDSESLPVSVSKVASSIIWHFDKHCWNTVEKIDYTLEKQNKAPNSYHAKNKSAILKNP